jgi:hypothetical protein
VGAHRPSICTLRLFLKPEPGVRPGGRLTFFCFAKRKSAKKRRPHCACPSAALRATCGARAAGLPQNSLRSLRSLRSDSCGKSVHEARLSFGRRAAGGTALLGTRRGDRTPTRHGAYSWGVRVSDGTGPARTRRLKERRDQATRSVAVGGQAKRWPDPLPSGCAEERRGVGPHACRRTGVLRDLTCRSCLSAVNEVNAASSAAGRRREHRRLPPKGVADSGVAFSLLTFFWRRKRK